MHCLFVAREIDKNKKVLYLLCNLEKAFNRAPRKMMEWVMRKKGLLEVMVRPMMRIYHGTQAKS